MYGTLLFFCIDIEMWNVSSRGWNARQSTPKITPLLMIHHAQHITSLVVYYMIANAREVLLGVSFYGTPE